MWIYFGRKILACLHDFFWFQANRMYLQQRRKTRPRVIHYPHKYHQLHSIPSSWELDWFATEAQRLREILRGLVSTITICFQILSLCLIYENVLPTQNYFQALFKMKHMNKQKTIFKTLSVSVPLWQTLKWRFVGFWVLPQVFFNGFLFFGESWEMIVYDICEDNG